LQAQDDCSSPPLEKHARGEEGGETYSLLRVARRCARGLRALLGFGLRSV
jgi:hypothetical protein